MTTPPPEFRDRMRELRKVPIASILDFAAGNPVDRKPEDIARLDASLDTNGYAMPVLVRELPNDGGWETLDGHGRVDRIRERWPEVTELTVLVLDVANAADGRKLLLGLRQGAKWGMAELDAWVAQGLAAGELDLDETMTLSGYTAADLDSLANAGRDLLAQLPTAAPLPPAAAPTPTHGPSIVREIDAPEPPKPKATITKPGDVWRLGRHVLVCGDSTAGAITMALEAAGARPRLIWTDPPWNVGVNDPANIPQLASGRKIRRRDELEVANDKLGEDFGVFLDAMIVQLGEASDPGTILYMAMSPQEYGLLDSKLRAAEWHWSSMLIWGKDNFVPGRKDYHAQHEPLWYGWREGAARRVPLRDRTQSDLWLIDRPRRSDAHPTMKPIRLVARCIENSSMPGDLVLDPFGGSGTTALAAEQTDRAAALVELDPSYCDVIVERWQRLTGGKAVRQ